MAINFLVVLPTERGIIILSSGVLSSLELHYMRRASRTWYKLTRLPAVWCCLALQLGVARRFTPESLPK